MSAAVRCDGACSVFTLCSPVSHSAFISILQMSSMLYICLCTVAIYVSNTTIRYMISIWCTKNYSNMRIHIHSRFFGIQAKTWMSRLGLATKRIRTYITCIPFTEQMFANIHSRAPFSRSTLSFQSNLLSAEHIDFKLDLKIKDFFFAVHSFSCPYQTIFSQLSFPLSWQLSFRPKFQWIFCQVLPRWQEH